MLILFAQRSQGNIFLEEGGARKFKEMQPQIYPSNSGFYDSFKVLRCNSICPDKLMYRHRYITRYIAMTICTDIKLST